eukprot:TRINITY_DN10338_c0_g1_i2.p1 TRINITY_DN10338_c0_g1~~TRINITY_DN10338_c0_g1_i2.p1  ORF type:complete len:291 (+),score=43.37 TRINITY_DN10338_c0_g1_i2:22-894(+)
MQVMQPSTLLFMLAFCRLVAMEVIQRVVAQEGMSVSKCLVHLGVVPQLLTMVNNSYPPPYHISSLKALIHLCNGNSSGKIAVLEAGGLEKLSNLHFDSNSTNLEIQELIAVLLLELSTIALNKAAISSPALSILISILSNSRSVSATAKQATIKALFNLSTCFENLNSMLSPSTVESLFKMTQETDKKIRYKCLCILSSVLLTEPGRKSLEVCVESNPKVLVGILAKEEEPNCQERAGFIVMVLAHHSSKIRRVLRGSEGLVQAVIEMGLVGKSGNLRNMCFRIIRSLKG